MDELIRKQDALDAFNGEVTVVAARNAGRVYTYLKMVTDRIKALPPVQPEILACGEGELNVPDTNVGDIISRQAAIDALDEQIEQCNKALGSFDISLKDEFAIKVERASLKAYREQLENLPTVQPTIIRCRDCKYSIDEYNDGDCYCKRPSRELVWIGKSWDFFCKAGDKREGKAYDQ